MAAGRKKAGVNRNPWFQVQQDAARGEKKEWQRKSMSARDKRYLKFLEENGY